MTEDTVAPPPLPPDDLDGFDDTQLFEPSEIDKLKAQVEKFREKWIATRMKYLKARCLVGERERIMDSIEVALDRYKTDNAFLRLRSSIQGALGTRTELGDYITKEDVAMLDAEEDKGLIQERLRAINNEG